MAPDGTATSTASASDASPPSGPSSVTSCPAFRQRAASPPPTVPLPTVVILIAQMMPDRRGTLRECRATGGWQRRCGDERDESTAGPTDPAIASAGLVRLDDLEERHLVVLDRRGLTRSRDFLANARRLAFARVHRALVLP
jgi:hypothetical protein